MVQKGIFCAIEECSYFGLLYFYILSKDRGLSGPRSDPSNVNPQNIRGVTNFCGMWWTDLTRNVMKKWNTCDEPTWLKMWKKKRNTLFRCFLFLYFERNNSNQWPLDGLNWKTSAPGLHKFIIVYFRTDYRRPTLFPGYPNWSGWVMIHHINAQWYTKTPTVGGNFKEHKQTMISLVLCWDWKNWKAQGQKYEEKSVYI